MKKNYLLLLSLSSALTVSSQLDTVTYFNQVINDLKTFDDKLFVAGGFTQNEGSTCYWSAYYDGFNINRHTTLIGGSGIRGLDVFNSELYNVGTLQVGSAIGVDVWDGYTWDDAGSTNYSHSTIYADGNDLYVESDNGLIRKKTGTGSWNVFYDFAGDGGIGAIMRYGSNIIFGGSFTTIDGNSYSNIAQWNGTSWSSLGTGVNGTVGRMIVYNGELYVSGEFTLAGSTTVSKIAKWNGSTWSDVGGGIGSGIGTGISDMIVHDSKLYVVGNFSSMGGNTADDFAYWNGSSWTGINYSHPESSMRCIEVFNNELYIGTFDFSKSRLYRYMGGVGIAENSISSQLDIYPNPSNGIYTITLSENDQLRNFIVYNNQGQEIYSGNEIIIDITNQKSGVYYVKLNSDLNSSTIMILKN